MVSHTHHRNNNSSHLGVDLLKRRRKLIKQWTHMDGDVTNNAIENLKWSKIII